MKMVMGATVLLGMTAVSAMADPAKGVWQTQPGDNGGFLHVAIAPCGAAVCGVIKKAFEGSGKTVANYEHLNKRMLWDMKPKGNGSYGGGKVWAADRNKTYNSKMQLNGNALTVEGCVLGICRGQTWKRVN